MFRWYYFIIIWVCQCSNNTWNCEQWFMKNPVQNVIHDEKRFDDISLLEFVISQCSKNTWKSKQGFMKHLVKTVIFDSKRFNDILLLEFVICQCSSNTWKCE